MTNQKSLLALYKTRTGKTTYTPKTECENPVGYQVAKVDTIKTYGTYRP